MRATASLLTLAAIGLAAAGCGADDKPAAASPKSTGPYGAYTRTVTKADIARTQGIRDESGPEAEKPKGGPARLTIAKGSGQDVLKVSDVESDFSVVREA